MRVGVNSGCVVVREIGSYGHVPIRPSATRSTSVLGSRASRRREEC